MLRDRVHAGRPSAYEIDETMIELADEEEAVSELLRTLAVRLQTIAERESRAAMLGLPTASSVSDRRRLIRQMDRMLDQLESYYAKRGTKHHNAEVVG